MSAMSPNIGGNWLLVLAVGGSIIGIGIRGGCGRGHHYQERPSRVNRPCRHISVSPRHARHTHRPPFTLRLPPSTSRYYVR
ncbi:hypothetical protein BU24DRAFT_416271 [Aaosphaeria arxii CBS 175.79]|uniref:Uncharacterized protein n=1 Tax=Aaosphaeria arxii CBS 175.79 TaxID=1450172 RepID=A0A6A5Y723_9PLEO|nr:uncharacterized protein BU24DRAFT_416271 [Aaosphaeria arxii CBS 175.79]KAF2020600.1 hypothetical protein BU24DRAFT_416271 [Aaosphaeria arxii CBS 175.79]